MAIVLQRPDSARARPSSLLKKEEDYLQLFSGDYPIEVYLVVAKLIKGVQSYLRSLSALQPKDKTNLTFYVAMHAASALTKKPNPSVKDIVAINLDLMDDALLTASFDTVGRLYENLGASDQIAKGTQLIAGLKAALTESFVQS